VALRFLLSNHPGCDVELNDRGEREATVFAAETHCETTPRCHPHYSTGWSPDRLDDRTVDEITLDAVERITI
jgi:hypothetical protein